MPPSAERSVGTSDRLGVRGRLLLAFFGISAFAVLAAAAAMYSFLEVGKALNQITQDRVPSTVGAQQLSRQAERIAAATPALLTVNSSEQHKQASERLFGELERLNALLGTLRERTIDRESLALIEGLVDRLGNNLVTLDSMIVNKLDFVAERRNLLRDLRFADLSSRRLLAPGILVMDAKLAELGEALESHRSAGAQSPDVLADLADPIVSLAPLQRVRAEVSTIHDTLVNAASAESLADLGVLVLPLRRALDELNELMGRVEPGIAARLSKSLAKFRGLVDGSHSIIAARQSELKHLTRMRTLVEENVDISRQLTTAVDRLVSITDQDIRNASREAQAVQHTSTVIMVTVVVLSLVCAGLIVWLYVGRNLIARLTALSNSMLAIAAGNLETPLPAGGGDEIGHMAKALTVFRDTAVEVRESNLREINETRRRLIDAIESISEGFSLYDANDRLVVCNTMYRKLLYPGIEDVVTPGASFETIVRTAAERGLIRDAVGRIDEWVAERMARHRNPGEPHLQRRDERWILISERNTQDGGTVAVYADITELKQREEELAEKSNALEQLSNQLAKYLSPQVYDSIFSGRQEVRVTSTRKKLTVFFSDIVGFTEAAERLESEELTHLLNHYLTEMSRIALDHGATVDKYVGDAILAFFGDPESRGVKEDAIACVNMAIAMRRRMHDLEDIWRGSGIERPLRVRTGIHTGFCTVGNFGSEDRMDYTIVGTAVNTASRLQSVAAPGEILVSYETFAQIRDLIHCEDHGEVEVKGVPHPIATYRVVDTYENLDRERRRFREAHHTMTLDLDLEAMTSDERKEAIAALHRALALLSKDKHAGLARPPAKDGSDPDG